MLNTTKGYGMRIKIWKTKRWIVLNDKLVNMLALAVTIIIVGITIKAVLDM